MQTRGGQIADAGQDVSEPSLRIDVVEAGCGDEREHDGGAVGTALRTGEGPDGMTVHVGADAERRILAQLPGLSSAPRRLRHERL